MAVLRYGVDSSVQLELADGRRSTQSDTPRGTPLSDPAAALTAMLEAPLDYPPLARGTTPGDRVVLALDHGLPQAAEVAAAVVHALMRAGIDPDGITILRRRAELDDQQCDPCRLLAEPVRQRITLVTHDPADRERLAYLAANQAGDPILVHRAMQDADLVLPIGCLHAESAAGYFGIHGVVSPTFSDQATLQRYRSPETLDGHGKHKQRLIDDADHVAWLLGVQFTIQLIPGVGDAILHVLAGQSESVRRRGRELYAAAWGCSEPAGASLVVAAIEGGRSQQTWENFGRALDAAGHLVEDGGSIAVCCDLEGPLGPAMRHLAGSPSQEAALRRIRRECPPDALPAAQLARTLQRNKVYLLSRMDPSIVEDLDMIHVAAPEELTRLARQHESCILLADAPHVVVGDY